MKDLPKDFGLKRLKAALVFIKDHGLAVDVGAHKGIWTQEMMKVFKEVHSFEPVPSNFEVLKEINQNSYNYALGGRSEKEDVFLAPGSNTGMYHIGISGIPAQMKRLDDFFLGKIDFLKIDVEGYEYNVIAGGLETIKRDHPAILLEENGLLSRYGKTRDDLWGLLKSLGYKVMAIFNDDYLWVHKKDK